MLADRVGFRLTLVSILTRVRVGVGGGGGGGGGRDATPVAAPVTRCPGLPTTLPAAGPPRAPPGPLDEVDSPLARPPGLATC